MDYTITQDHVAKMESGNVLRIATIRCRKCDNAWFIQASPEFEPSHCCYCGIRFRGSENPDGTIKLDRTLDNLFIQISDIMRRNKTGRFATTFAHNDKWYVAIEIQGVWIRVYSAETLKDALEELLEKVS